MRSPQVWSGSTYDVPLAVLMMRLRVFTGPIMPGSMSLLESLTSCCSPPVLRLAEP